MTADGSPERFDDAYYQRYYFDPRTAVTSKAEMNARGRLIAAMADHIGLPVKRILDVGCGVGLLRAPLRRAWPKATYAGTEISEYLCRRYGWHHGPVEELPTKEQYDVVVCYDVMQYLDEPAARKAMGRLAKVCRGLLYFGALTSEDWKSNCDRTRTDGAAFLRPGAWYRSTFDKWFICLGAGFWLRRNTGLSVWELDTAGQVRGRAARM